MCFRKVLLWTDKHLNIKETKNWMCLQAKSMQPILTIISAVLKRNDYIGIFSQWLHNGRSKNSGCKIGMLFTYCPCDFYSKQVLKDTWHALRKERKVEQEPESTYSLSVTNVNVWTTYIEQIKHGSKTNTSCSITGQHKIN